MLNTPDPTMERARDRGIHVKEKRLVREQVEGNPLQHPFAVIREVNAELLQTPGEESWRSSPGIRFLRARMAYHGVKYHWWDNP